MSFLNIYHFQGRLYEDINDIEYVLCDNTLNELCARCKLCNTTSGTNEIISHSFNCIYSINYLNYKKGILKPLPGNGYHNYF